MIRRTTLPTPNFRKLFESAPGLYIVLLPDPNFTIIAVSDAYAKTTMIERNTVLGKGIFDVFPDNPDDPQARGEQNLKSSLSCVIKHRLQDSMAVQKYDIRRPESQGGGFEERYWSPVNSPVLDDDGNLIYIIHRVEDVTAFIHVKQMEARQAKLSEELKAQIEKKESEVFIRAQQIQQANSKLYHAHTELERLYAKVKDLDAIKTQFFANVSHELRTPLTLILGPIQQLLSEGGLSELQTRTLEVVLRNSKTLLKHVNDLLDVAKIEAGKMVVNYSNADLAKIVRITAAHFETVMQSNGLTLLIETPDTILTQIDQEKIQRVIMNLLSNAIKFVPTGGWVKCSVVKRNDNIILMVSDNGSGVKKELRETIFERFQQGENGHARTFSGTGLGLAIAKDFVELHHGTIRVAETPGGGATFIIDLPLTAPAGTTVQTNEISTTSLTGLTPRPILNRKTCNSHLPAFLPNSNLPIILVVEDNPDMREFIELTLGRQYQIIQAEDGRDGLEKATTFRPDLILSDIMMPRMSGDQMIMEIRKNHDLDTIPIIFLTAKTDDEMKIKLLSEGCQDYLTKPFSQKELQLRVHNWVTVKRAKDILSKELKFQSGDLFSLTRGLTQKKKTLQLAVESLQLANEQAEKANASKSHFLSLISHEMNTPLTSLILTLQVILRKGVKIENEKNYIRIVNAANRLRSLIETLLNYTQIDSGKTKLVLQEIDLKKFTEDLIEEVQPFAKEKHLTISAEIVGNFSKPLISDLKLFHIIFYNLLINAIKFTHQGHIRFSIQNLENFFIFSVQDTGVGISVEDQVRIFEPFVQVGTLAKREGVSGVGLGLTIVKQIVQDLDGSIEIQSELNKGSTFTVKLPIRASQKITQENLEKAV